MGDGLKGQPGLVTGCGGLGAQLVCCQGWLPLCLLLHLPLGHASVPRGIEGTWLERAAAAPQGARACGADGASPALPAPAACLSRLGSSCPPSALRVVLWHSSCSTKCGTCVDAGSLCKPPTPRGRIWPQWGPAKRILSLPHPSSLPPSWSCLLATAPGQDLGCAWRDVTLSMHQSFCHLESDGEVINPHGSGWAEARRAMIEHPRDASARVAAGCSASSLTPIPATITIQLAIREELKDN